MGIVGPGVRARFNADPVTGRDAVRDVWAGFCDGVSGVRHDVVEQWTQGEATIVQADVTYTRKDDSTVTVPVVTIYRGKGDLIVEVMVATPTKLTNQQRELMKQLSETMIVENAPHSRGLFDKVKDIFG